MVKEIIFFCGGDSNNMSFWSNVPYLFTKTLEEKGIIVRRINLGFNWRINKLFKIYTDLLAIKYPNHTYSFVCTRLAKYINKIRINKAIKKYNTADCCIFICFDYYTPQKKCILFCDWTLDVLIYDRQKREKYKIEERFCKQQENAIDNADVVISMFPKCAESMRKINPNANIIYLGTNVVNDLSIIKYSRENILNIKSISKSILFIGRKHYLKGAKLLIKAFLKLLEKDPSLELNIIGLERNDFEDLPANVNCYGFLRKENREDNIIYYKLLSSAKVFVNPTPQWGGYSSTIEAMFYYNPIVISPYADFIKEFSSDIKFGVFNNEFTTDSLVDSISQVIYNIKYRQLCIEAHNSVENYSWSNYVDRILNTI